MGIKKLHLIRCGTTCVHEEVAKIQHCWIRGFGMSALQIVKIEKLRKTVLHIEPVFFFYDL